MRYFQRCFKDQKAEQLKWNTKELLLFVLHTIPVSKHKPDFKSLM